MALSTTLSLNVISTLTSSLDLVTASAPMTYKKNWTLADGAGANQAQQIFSDRRTIAASGTEDLDLSGSLTNALGATVAFTKVKAIIVYAAATNTNNVIVTRPASNGVPLFVAASDAISIPPDGCFCFIAPTAAGIGVTNSTADLLTISNSAGSTEVVYDIVVIGATA